MDAGAAAECVAHPIGEGDRAGECETGGETGDWEHDINLFQYFNALTLYLGNKEDSRPKGPLTYQLLILTKLMILF